MCIIYDFHASFCSSHRASVQSLETLFLPFPHEDKQPLRFSDLYRIPYLFLEMLELMKETVKKFSSRRSLCNDHHCPSQHSAGVSDSVIEGAAAHVLISSLLVLA